MRGDTNDDPTPHLRRLCKSHDDHRAERNTDTVMLDGAGNPYGDGEPVEKADDDDRDPIDTDDLTDDLKAASEAARPDSLGRESLAKSAEDRPERVLTEDAIQQSLHDQGLSTKEAVLEVRDELRDLRADGVAGTEGDPVEKADDGGPEEPEEPGETDANPGGDGGETPRLASDDPVPESVDDLAERDPALAKALGIPLTDDGSIPEDRQGWARHRYLLAKRTAGGASA